MSFEEIKGWVKGREGKKGEVVGNVLTMNKL
jgi:hypothetical protein